MKLPAPKHWHMFAVFTLLGGIGALFVANGLTPRYEMLRICFIVVAGVSFCMGFCVFPDDWE